MKQKLSLALWTLVVIPGIMQCNAQQSESSKGWKLERMPNDLETDFALSSLPGHLREASTVYLLDPDKGFYISRKGSNGFICFVLRTEWERGEYRDDLASPISFDSEGARTIFPAYADAEAMRASGKYTASQLKDIMTERFNKGTYKAPGRPGVSYMLAPMMRTYDGASSHVVTMELPHHMFYAPYLTNADLGTDPNAGALILLGDGKSPHQFMIIAAGATEKAKILEEHKELMKRLVAYRSYFATQGGMHH
jgi:hypothetical protein